LIGAEDEASTAQGETKVRSQDSHISHDLYTTDGSVAELSACWTQAQKVLGSNRSHDAVG